MDRNTIIGFVLLGLLLFVYLFTSTRNNHELEAARKRQTDSLAIVQHRQEALDSTRRIRAVSKDTATSGWGHAVDGTEKLITVETDLLKVVFSTQGGQPKEVILKKFKSADSTPVRLIDATPRNRFNYAVNTGANQTSQAAELFFEDSPVQKNADGSQSVTFKLTTQTGASIEHVYTLRDGSYLVDWNLVCSQPGSLFSQSTLHLDWMVEMEQTQPLAEYERRLSNVCFSVDNSFDYISSKTEKTFEKPVQWVAASQQFFNRTLISKTGFESGSIKWARETVDSSRKLGTVETELQAKLPSAGVPMQFQWYYGPNDFKLLKAAAPGMDKIVDLGRDMYSFVRPLNVYVIMPVFNFFKKFTVSYGIAILLLVLFIRLLTSPLVYSSYLSGAKMKALRPEIEAMKKRVGNEQQAVAAEQMKLFREAGVNPVAGCIPALLQIPIFFALYSFFNSNIALRGQPYLWSHDLSVYDTVIKLGFTIPAYGNHISLFATLAVVTSFLISLYGMSMTPDQSNPAMKYMPYIMPVMLLLFFNRLPSALTWYYTVSNLITLVLQFVIQNYIIDHEKILAKLQANRAKPKSKSKWQERLEQMQENQRKMQQQQPRKKP